MTTLFIAGATGLVGSCALQQAIAHPDITAIIAPTRSPLKSHPKLSNPQLDFDDLPKHDSPIWKADTAICALGTTIKTAGSREAFRHVDFDYPLAIAEALRAAGCKSFSLNSSLGAKANARTFYSRVKGEIEQAIAQIEFPSYTIVRPSVLGGRKVDRRPDEIAAKFLLTLFSPLLPKRLHVISASAVAHSLLQSAIKGETGKRIIESEEIHLNAKTPHLKP